MAWKKPSGASGVTSLTQLTDVSTTTPIDGQVLTYNSATSKWGPEDPSTGTGGGSNILMGKSLGVIGSSSSSTVDGTYIGFIKNRNAMTATTVAVAGTAVGQQINQVDLLPLEIDLVLAMIGANDSRGTATIGTFADRVPAQNTFYANLHELCRKMLVKWGLNGTTRIGIASSHYFGTWPNLDFSSSTDPYYEIIKEVAEFYSIPYLPTYAVSNIPYHVTEIRSLYVQSDNIHLTQAGHEKLSYPVEAFLRQMLGDM